MRGDEIGTGGVIAHYHRLLLGLVEQQGDARQNLTDLDITRLRLITSNPAKYGGLEIVGRVGLPCGRHGAQSALSADQAAAPRPHPRRRRERRLSRYRTGTRRGQPAHTRPAPSVSTKTDDGKADEVAKGAAVVLAVLAVPFTTAVAPPPAQGLQWQQCAKIAEGWANGEASECATVRVPLDYRQPGGRQLTIAVSRVRASDPAHRQGVVLVNPGGPGEQGTTFPTSSPGLSWPGSAARTT
ncbi:hypothetical protein AB0F91_44720 [Amycolatopsis sp. NPDC023774]|uniref:hypothetical protein n=1 Tax=Amycolatopsis sp. NPDC023774 TaxID=3155015 RepID=UPI0033D1564A